MKNAIVLSSAILALITASAQGALISSWENALGGWERDDANGLLEMAYNPGGVGYSTTVGVTNGTHSLRAIASGSYSNLIKNFTAGPTGIRQAFLDAGNATNPVVATVDFTIPAGSIAASGGTYVELILPRAYGNPASYDDSLKISIVGFAQGVTATVTFPVPTGFASAGSDFWGTFLNLNTDRSLGTGEIYFDNFNVSPVPEPATLAVTVVAGAMILLRRRA